MVEDNKGFQIAMKVAKFPNSAVGQRTTLTVQIYRGSVVVRALTSHQMNVARVRFSAPASYVS